MTKTWQRVFDFEKATKIRIAFFRAAAAIKVSQKFVHVHIPHRERQLGVLKYMLWMYVWYHNYNTNL